MKLYQPTLANRFYLSRIPIQKLLFLYLWEQSYTLRQQLVLYTNVIIIVLFLQSSVSYVVYISYILRFSSRSLHLAILDYSLELVYQAYSHYTPKGISRNRSKQVSENEIMENENCQKNAIQSSQMQFPHNVQTFKTMSTIKC